MLLGSERDVEVGSQHPLEGIVTTSARNRVPDLVTLRGLPSAGTARLFRAGATGPAGGSGSMRAPVRHYDRRRPAGTGPARDLNGDCTPPL